MSVAAAATRPAERARLRLSEQHKRWIIGALAIVVALVIWQLLGSTGLVRKSYISSPGSALSAGRTMLSSGELWSNCRTSLVSFVIGFAISIGIGVPLGLLMGFNQTVRQLTQPPIMALYVTPRLALLPVIIVWLGIGSKSTIVVVVIGAMIPIIINTMTGVREVDRKLLQVAFSFGASKFDVFRKILFPASLPMILSGIRLSVGSAVLGVVIAEMYVSTGGIGNLVTTYGQAYRTNYIVFLVALVAVFGWLVSSGVQMVERRVERWRPS